MTRFQFSLCYNFLVSLQLGAEGQNGISGSGVADDATSFTRVVGVMDVVPFLGNTLNLLFPIVSGVRPYPYAYP